MKTLLLMAVFGVLFSSQQSLACSCIPLPDHFEQTFGASEAVFLGIPTERNLLPGSEAIGGKLETLFTIVSSFKGTAANELNIQSLVSSAACGMTFDQKALYLVFAHQGENGLETTICSSTVLAADSEPVANMLLRLVELREQGK